MTKFIAKKMVPFELRKIMDATCYLAIRFLCIYLFLTHKDVFKHQKKSPLSGIKRTCAMFHFTNYGNVLCRSFHPSAFVSICNFETIWKTLKQFGTNVKMTFSVHLLLHLPNCRSCFLAHLSMCSCLPLGSLVVHCLSFIQCPLLHLL